MPTHRRHIQTNAPASVFQSHMAINKDGWVLFFSSFSFFPRKWDSISFNCTKFTLRRVRATIQSLGDLGLWGLNASSEQLLRCCGTEPACLAKHSPQVGNLQMVLVSRWAAGERGGSGSVHLCSASRSKGMLGAPPRPAADSSPELAAETVLSVWSYQAVGMGWLCCTLSFWLQSPC